MKEAEPAAGHAMRRWNLDPVLMMLVALAIAILLTWLVPSGQYQRSGTTETSLVVPGTYHELPKARTPAALLPRAAEPGAALPVSPVALITAIPAGLIKSAPLIFMIMTLGGMFAILRGSGALDAGIERLLGLTGSRIGLIVPAVMVCISAGSTFLGFISEYLLIIPLMVALSERLGMGKLFGFAMLTLAAKVGYLASVTNPVALPIAQPIVGLPIFSGLPFRLAIWILYLSIAIGVILRLGRRQARLVPEQQTQPLSRRHFGILLLLLMTVVVLIAGSAHFHWRESEFAALFILMGAAMILVTRVSARDGANAFVEGMKSMMLAAVLVGMARGVELILREGRILDTIVAWASHYAVQLPPVLVAPLIMVIEMGLTLLIPSTSAKAALSIPILAPIAQTAGVSGQTTVLAFLLGNGLVNMIAPTSGVLLAYLATAEIAYGKWFRFILPIFLAFTAIGAALTMLAVAWGY